MLITSKYMLQYAMNIYLVHQLWMVNVRRCSHRLTVHRSSVLFISAGTHAAFRKKTLHACFCQHDDSCSYNVLVPQTGL